MTAARGAPGQPTSPPAPSADRVAERLAEQPADRLAAEPAARPAPEPAPATGLADQLAAPALSQLFRTLGVIAAPTTLLSALLYYFGWMHAYAFFGYFGVHSTLLGLTTQDFVQRSVDGLFVPMVVVACAVLLGVWGHAMLRSWLAVGVNLRALRGLLLTAALGGLALTVVGMSSVVGRPLVSEPVAAAPLSLAVGVLLLVYAVHLWRALAAAARGTDRAALPPWAAVAEWAAVFVLVGLSLFWAAADYATAVGVSRARNFVAGLPDEPAAVLYSAQSLSLAMPGVQELRCHDPDATYRFRYDGLKLVLQSGDQYVFVPAAWSPADGIATVIPRSGTLRLEFLPASATAAPPPTC